MPLPRTRCGSSSITTTSTIDSFIPTRPWQLAEACNICGRGFNYLRGRHHCRHCGASVCSKHSRNKAVVPSSLSAQRQRVCDECFPECQRGVTRRRKTVGARAISLRFVDDGSDCGGTTATVTGAAKTHLADCESTTTTAALTTITTSTSSTNPASVVFSTPLRLPPTTTAASECVHDQRPPGPRRSPSSKHSARDLYQHQQLRRQHQQQRRRVSTTDSKHKAHKRHVDSFTSSSNASSFSSLNDHSSNSSSDLISDIDDSSSNNNNYSSGSDSSDDEELIATYLRRGAPLRSLGSATGKPQRTRTAHGAHHRIASASPWLEAIEEKQALEASLPLRRSSKHSRASQDEGGQEETAADAAMVPGEPQTPPSRLNLKAVALAYSEAVKAASARTASLVTTTPLTPRSPDAAATAVPARSTTTAPRKTAESTPASPQTAVDTDARELTERDYRVMREIEALELEIQKHQSELPALLEALQQTEHTAARLQNEVQESRLRVQQYKQAQCVVNRSVRNAKALMHEREFQAAILELLRASGIDRACAAVWYLLAECRLHVSQLESAEQACRKCMRLQQQQGRSVCASAALLGRILQQQGRSDDAVEWYLIALERR